uniref:NADH-ubiquinone oxidoreductase chain 5 n=1 Tax=Hiatula diphos TaxID=1125681 RepID=I6NJB4_9BIVA|nr:NADH dehydrogenase subunit 5 [Hiatula diphos]AEV94284.1 NADH dehydrogenase subunit 5 [Hiatula diphos]
MYYPSKVYSYFNLLACFILWVGWMGLYFVMGRGVVLFEVDLLCGELLNMSVPFVLDTYSVMFSFVVLLISSSVMLYNGFYMDGEVFYNRFCKLVLLFVLSMLFLVFIPSLLGLMVGWDGLGLTSYLLVIYYQDKRSLGSGTLTVLSNRIGDVLFFIGIGLASSVSSWGFLDLGQEKAYLFWGVIIVGCMTKSAQIPFSAWLPAAMAAPSPVSALVHSSTLVTAGVYVLIRFSACISGGWFMFLGMASTLTMLMSAVSAVFEPDAKKVVALSTLSQLGVMMFAISMGAISVCYFHMVSHALFKALMFLCVGAVIHFSGIQDLRYLGGFLYSSPVIMGWLTVACLSLMGFPFLSGFYSKDLVLEAFLTSDMSVLFVAMSVLATCLTAFYSGLMLYSVSTFSIGASYSSSMISSYYVIVPCSILGIGALFGGITMQSFSLGFNVMFYVQGLFKLVPILCVVSGLCALGGFVMIRGLNYSLLNLDDYEGSMGLAERAVDMLAKMWFMPFLSSDLFSSRSLSLSRGVKDYIEDGHLEYSLGSEGVWVASNSWSSYYVGSQSDYIGLCFVKGVLFFVIIVFISSGM